jgi:hypothetical protein
MPFPPPKKKKPGDTGDFGSPAPLDDPAAKPPKMGGGAPPAGGAEPDEDDQGGGSGGMTPPSPEALHYHADPQSCGTCEHMDEGGNCAVLGMQVTPEGWCSAYEGKSDDGQQAGGMPGPGAGAPPMPPAGRGAM